MDISEGRREQASSTSRKDNRSRNVLIGASALEFPTMYGKSRKAIPAVNPGTNEARQPSPSSDRSAARSTSVSA